VTNDHKDCVKALRQRKALDKVHINGTPWSGQDQKKLESAIKLVVDNLGSCTDHTRFDIFGDEQSHFRPEIPSLDE
jgi:hypothetical protein